ncbi:hypothetical protein V5O48_002181 [Marasmius crinis-equi]|uniref:Uncharacterized protein n=1 Tax=Marasmius crinis-equi TaxID=585013 RepID=A0ABR3FWB8_9AGAR
MFRIDEIGASVSYASQAVARFPDAVTAINYLRKLGSPPPTITFSRTTPKIDNVCQAFTALSNLITENKTSLRYVYSHWDTILLHWTYFMLQSVILSSEARFTAIGSEYFERCLSSLVIILQFPGDQTRIIKQLSLRLQIFATRTWYLLLDIRHSLRAPWSLVLVNFVRCDSPMIPLLSTEDSYTDPVQMGRIVLKHLQSEMLEIKKKKDDAVDVEDKKDGNFDGLHIVMVLLNSVPGHVRAENTILRSTNVNFALRVMTRITKFFLLTKSKHLRDAEPFHQLSSDAHDIVRSSLRIVLTTAQQPVRICRILHFGIVHAIMHADMRYHALDRRREAEGLSVTVASESTEILERITKYLVFPNVLRQFRRCALNIMFDGNFFVQTGATIISNAWKKALDRSEDLYRIRQIMKQTSGLCSHRAAS